MSENKSQKSNSQDSQKNILPAVTVVLGLVLVGVSVYSYNLWSKNKELVAGADTVAADGRDVGSLPTPALGAPAPNQPIADAGDPTKPPIANDLPLPMPSEDDHTRGNPGAKIALIEYSDYDCPFCDRFHVTAKQALDHYGDQMMWVYRHFPLDMLHADARKKSEASECVASLAGEEAFWEFSDILYAEKPSLGEFGDVVSGLGVDVDAYNDCVDSGDFAQKVKDQEVGGQATYTDASSGRPVPLVNGTPGNFIVNLETGDIAPVRGAVPFEMLQDAIDGLL